MWKLTLAQDGPNSHRYFQRKKSNRNPSPTSAKLLSICHSAATRSSSELAAETHEQQQAC